jgi:O-antigen/teichoic acid export membrane protein
MSKSKKVFALVLAQAFNAFVNFFFFPYFVRVLSQEEYGTYGQVLLVSDTIRTLAALGLGTIVYVSMGQAKESKSGLDAASVFKSIFYSSIFLSLVGCLITVFSADFFGEFFKNEKIVWLLKVYALSIIFFIPYTILNSLLIFLGYLKRSVFIFSTILVLKVILIVAAVEVFHSLSAVFYALVGLGFLQLSLMLYFTPKEYLCTGRFRLDFALDRLKLGAQLGFIELIWFCTAYTDRFLVSSELSVDAFAIYRNGTIELPVIGTLYTSIAAIILPLVSKLYSEKKYDEIVALKKRSITATCGVLYPIICYLIVFSYPLVLGYFSSKYEASALVFAIISCNLFLRVNDYQDILVSAAKGKTLVAIYLVTFILNLFASYFLIRKFGYIGAAFSTLASYFICTAALFLFSARAIQKSWMDFLEFKKLFFILGISLLLPLLCSWIGGTKDLILVLIYGFFTTTLSYFLFLYFQLISYDNLAPLVERIPLFGSKLNHYCHSIFTKRNLNQS